MSINKIINFKYPMSKKRFLIYLTILFFMTIIFSFIFYLYAIDISGETEYNFSNSKKIDLENKPLAYISVISRYPPNIIFRGYQPIMDYLTSKSSYRFELKLTDDYEEAIRKLVKGEVVAAFIGSYIYVQAHEKYGIVPILKPLNENHEPFSRAVLFTSENSTIFNISDLKNKKLALPSTQSLSSNWMLKYEFSKSGIKESDLQLITNFPHHQSVIYNVIKNNYDAGVTREYLLKKLNSSAYRIILYSDPFPTPPIVVAKNSPKLIVEEIKRALLELNPSNLKLDEITKDWDSEFIYGFIAANDQEYDIVRKISKVE